MKKIAIYGMAAVCALAIVACGGGNQQQQVVNDVPNDSIVNAILGDSTLYGICGEGSAMNTLQVLTDNGDTLNLDLTAARENNQILGGYAVGDRLALLSNNTRTAATLVVNINTLLGNWVMPNPIDGSSEVGIRIKEGGVAESIDQSSIIYKTWKFSNGLLAIVSVREGGEQMEEEVMYQILKLGADSLVYKTVGVPRGEEETFEYSRWKPKPEMDLHGLELESSEDEFRIDN
ncbi:MAG: lipocalin family protein [Prevotella sp.]|nr:lipocalin family protein [Prevotella sp.]